MVMVGMVNGTFLTKEKPGVGNNTQRNRTPQEETLVLGDGPWKILGMRWDRRTLVNRGIQITTKLGKNKDWIRRGLDKGRLGPPADSLLETTTREVQKPSRHDLLEAIRDLAQIRTEWLK